MIYYSVVAVNMKFDGYVKSPISTFRFVSCSLRRTLVRRIPRNLRRLELELFALPSQFCLFMRSSNLNTGDFSSDPSRLITSGIAGITIPSFLTIRLGKGSISELFRKLDGNFFFILFGLEFDIERYTVVSNAQ